MSGIINLLPDSLANQIAAGEVVQRPASVVKELLENALDADSTSVQLILKDSGKTLIQVVDNGQGMSSTDARMCFERHATSKINSSDDLFQIRSFGFRGEALASIAAIAHVDLKTKINSSKIGSHVVVEGSKIKKQEPVQINKGTSITVRNLFFNVPARRKFLKSDPVELKHILDEFARIAIPNPEVFFSVHHNDNELYHFPPSNLRQRISNYFGKTINENIVPVEEKTDFVSITGFIGKPELNKKSRGDQFLFVNRRFIKSNYLNHAIKSAYENLIPQDHFPFYAILIDIDPAMIDVNIHPTKQEIKFENERLIYNYVKVAVRHALGKYSITPSIDFENTVFQGMQSEPVKQFTSETNFSEGRFSQTNKGSSSEKRKWLEFYENISSDSQESEPITLTSDWSNPDEEELSKSQNCFQIHDSYIISPIKSGLLVIDQSAAHERIIYERNLAKLKSQRQLSQTNLFPETIQVNAKYVEILDSISNDLFQAGFLIEKVGSTTYVIKSTPADEIKISPRDFLTSFLATYVENLELQIDIQDNIARSIASHSKIKKGKKLTEVEMHELIDQLFACEMPFRSPSGVKCFMTFGLEELEQRFKTQN